MTAQSKQPAEEAGEPPVYLFEEMNSDLGALTRLCANLLARVEHLESDRSQARRWAQHWRLRWLSLASSSLPADLVDACADELPWNNPENNGGTGCEFR